MAVNTQKETQVEQHPKQVPVNDTDNKSGIIHGLVTILLALLVVALVSAGVFYYAVKNNIYGLADTLKPKLADKPILRLALPKEMPEYDPDAPENLTEKELVKKYEEYRTRTKELEESLRSASEEIERLNQEISSIADSKAVLDQNEATLESIKAERESLEEEKRVIAELVAKGDTEGFKAYFQSIDKVTAEAIYQDILSQEYIDSRKIELAKPFASMEPANAARVLTELFHRDKDKAIDIFEGLKADAKASILEKMDAGIAAEVTMMLTNRKIG